MVNWSKLLTLFRPHTKVVFYLDFDYLTKEEKETIRALCRNTGADFRFNKAYCLGKNTSVSIPLLTKGQFDLLKGGL
ncbi:MAG: hypothetical protein PHT07_23880 [Paludibacter sp.]|nr:hypothetical protein [Paludibacter sp.]